MVGFATREIVTKSISFKDQLCSQKNALNNIVGNWMFRNEIQYVEEFLDYKPWAMPN